MKVSVSGKNIEVTPALREYAEKKIGKLSRHFNYLNNDNLEAQVTFHVEKGRHIVEVTIPVNDIILRGEEETQDMYSSIDLVVEKLERQIEKFKTRLTKALRRESQKESGLTLDEQAEDEELKVVKVKRFAVKPMNVDEAVLQMNLLGHNFFVFTNAETDEINVVYRRKDGNYGLIVPEMM
ncbi:MAG: putative sigma-54 modulation protein [Tepidanaerobacteraceae bacterium]|uniref:Ribosome hibernation promoting factor n=1 Tax=Caldanaerovirga acetigignens TaxID=447595 RepID=A0A1M7IDL9_9FIRM|nr:ribosome-associated translation inhibitor RaiA [Caldanaerovirga acetigignens]MDN5331213.1 putative sigma-54 modulation protein [Tepidanaerobacteraceae bacterium]SHM38779.1 SSU ribosomal protein S30P/sigma 54 modulation protein [Caldanaerovirga acetigignens]